MPARRPSLHHGAAIAAALVALLVIAAPAGARDAFPRGFLWGTASAGFQAEAGGSPSHADRRSDWWAFTTDPGLIRSGVVSGDRVTGGPGFWRAWRGDLDRARHEAGSNAIRLGLEWSRIFPRSTAGVRTGSRIDLGDLRRLDRLADQGALGHYRRILRGAHRRGMQVMLTLNHYTLPLWVHDPIAVRAAFAGRGPDDPVPASLRRAGWLDPATVREFRKYAAYAAWKLGDDVDLWATLNEPLITVSQGFVSIPGVTGVKAPAVLSYPAALRAVEQLGLANAAAYDAIKAVDRRARVGFVHNMIAWRPADPSSPADVEATAHADRIFNRAWLDLAIRGVYDVDADGVVDPGERRPALAGKADFVGVNHYSPGRVTALGRSVSTTVPLFDFAPAVTYRGTGNPAGPPCPTTCSDFGWEIDPSGLRDVVEEAAAYGLPVYVTENGIDDPEDDQRPAYVRGYLGALHDAIAAGADVRGYFHWSLVDNYEWAEGFRARFGLYGYDPDTLERTPRRASIRLLRRAATANALP
ncbi:MAG TPA: glycoside hydrolase family 1 protein [Capillimicrobium sp.]|nr:glycoside hydrolase family 1 protein [Capillimicrobium sp.]